MKFALNHLADRLILSCLIASVLFPGSNALGDLSFSEMTDQANLGFLHDYLVEGPDEAALPMPLAMSAGVASGDYDNDGDVDLYVITGNRYPNVLLRNNGDGSFTDLAAEAGVSLAGALHSGPVFGDIDGDGWLDLLVGGLQGSGLRVFKNKGDGTFVDVTQGSGIELESDDQNDFSIALGDPDSDGDLDMYVGHWGTTEQVTHFWMNQGTGTFQKADQYAGVADIYLEEQFSFAPSFADVDGDARQDLLVTSDFDTSHILLNKGGLHFENTTT